MSFYEVLQKYPENRAADLIYSSSEKDVTGALSKKTVNERDLAALLSPAAEPFLERAAALSRAVTLRRFGKTIKIYAPVYLSNYCSNSCVYCGFSRKNDINRIALSANEIEEEAQAVSKSGIKNVILVTGDNPSKFSSDNLIEAVTICRKYFPFISVEVPTMEKRVYSALCEAGAGGLTMFQETYIERQYPDFHPSGPKADFIRRLDTPEIAASAGMRFIGLGALFGLADFRLDAFYMSLHAKYLAGKYWRSHISASFPRIRRSAGCFTPAFEVKDRNLFQMIFAYRLFFHDGGVNISTRESPFLRDKLALLGATTMSAGSKTEPGGYSKAVQNADQFSIEDNRSVDEFCGALKNMGIEPVMKDWDDVMNL